MSKIMYDTASTSGVARLPSDGYAYAGYVNGDYQTYPQVVKQFPHRKHVAIDVTGTATFDGLQPNAIVLDMERGDAPPEHAPDWVKRQRAAAASGRRITVYCNLSTWPVVLHDFKSQGVEFPDFWIAHYTGGVHEETYMGMKAAVVQYKNTLAFDKSAIFDPYWPDVVPV